MQRVLIISLIAVMIICFSSCKPAGPAGNWKPIETGKDNTFFELNFLTPEVGWLTGWNEKGPEDTGGWEILLTRDGGKTWNVLPKQMEQKIQFVHFANE